MTANQNPLQVVTGVGRGSYVTVFEPKINPLSGKTEHSMSFLIPKDDTDTINKLKRAAAAAAETKWASRRPANLRNPLRDGDEEKPDDEAYAGHYWINLKSKTRPGIVDKRMDPVTDPRDFVSGDYCRVSVSAYAYDQAGNRGVAFGLNNIQVIRKGEPLGGSAPPPEKDFTAFEDEADDDMFS